MRKLVVIDTRGEREVPLTGTITVGRDPTCTVVEDDPQVSRRHAEFVVGGDGVVVRDLQSRAGIRVNGVKVAEARLRPGDIVQLVNLRIRYVDDAALDDAVRSPRESEDDRTRFLRVPSSAADHPGASPVTAGREAPPDVEDRTRIWSAPPSREPAPPGASQPSARSEARTRPAAVPGPAPVRSARLSWGARVLLLALLLAVVVFSVTALALRIWSGRVIDGTAEARATALAQWLSAEVALAFRTGGDVGKVLERVQQEAGVADAVILRPEDGKVLAPSRRGTEQFAKVPGLEIAPHDVWRLQSQWNGELVEVVVPVAAASNPRQAVAWLRFNSALSGGGGMLVALAPVFLFAVALAIVVASMIRRSTLRGLASLSEDVELAASGRLSQVSDPMGVKPLKDLAETVNYVLIRLQAAERGDSRQPRAEGGTVREVIESSTVSRETRQPTAAPPAPARQLPRETHLVANASYRVTEAGPECAGILGVGPDTLIGQHLLDAIPDPRIVDAALKCLGTLPASGEERATASLEGKGYRVEVIVSRTGREQPMRIVFRPVEAA